MIPYIHITIPSYGLLAVIGLLAAMYWLYYQAILKGDEFLTFRQFLLLAVCCLAGCVIGSKLLFGITQIPEIVVDISWQNIAKAFVFGGFVFYGGLLGGLAGAAVFAKRMRRNVSEILNYVIPGFVLFHAFGRIGCLLAGCCYGFPLASDWQILGVIFHYFPLQAVEAVFEFAMFGVLIRYVPEKHRCMTYLFAYGIFRFAAEFFRGDTARGIWLTLSTSQWISILIIISLMIHWIRCTERCKAITEKVAKNSCNQEETNESHISGH